MGSTSSVNVVIQQLHFYFCYLAGLENLSRLCQTVSSLVCPDSIKKALKVVHNK